MFCTKKSGFEVTIHSDERGESVPCSSDQVLKVKLPSATGYTIYLKLSAPVVGRYFKYNIWKGEEAVETQNVYVPAGRDLAVFKGVFYSPTIEEVQNGEVPEGVEGQDNPRGSNLITVVVDEFEDDVDVEPTCDAYDRPTYRSLAAFKYGSSIECSAHTHSTMATCPKRPTGQTVMFKVQLSNLPVPDQELRNTVYKIRQDMKKRIAGAKSSRAVAEMEYDKEVQAIIRRKAALSGEVEQTIKEIEAEHATKERNARLKFQVVNLDIVLDANDEQFSGRFYGSTGGAAHSHGGPGL